MTQSLKIYQGEDETPVVDVTEPLSLVNVLFEEVEAGGRAYKGESNIGTFPMRDESAETGNPANLPAGLTHKSISAGSRIEWLVNGHRLFRGRIGPKDYSRGRQKSDRAREVVVSAQDTNYDLRNIIVDGWARPAETDVARISALLTTYLQGNPRVSTNISATYLSSSNTVSLPARVYDATDPASIIGEVASYANKNFFVTIDDELFYDGHDSTAYQAGVRISDRLSDLSAAGASCTPASTPTVVDSFITTTNSGGAGFLDKTNIVVEEGQTIVAFLSSNTTADWTWVRWYPDGVAGSGTGYSSLTKAAEAVLSGARVQMWVLSDAPASTNPAGGALRYQYSDALDKIVHGWVVLDGAGSYTSGTNNGTGTAASVSTGADPSDLVLDLLGWWQNVGTPANSTPGGSQSLLEQATLNAAAGQRDGEGALSTATGLATATWTTGTSVEWGHVSLAFSGAAGDIATFPPIWDVGPASTEDGMQLLSGLRLYYGQGSNTYVYVSDPTTANQYWHSEQSLYTSDPSINTPSRATTLAESILQRRKYEERTINVSIGPLEESQVGCLKPGQLIDIKARAVSYADDQFFSARIAQLRWTTPVPGTYFAHMMLDRPIKEAPYGVGPKSATDSINRHVEQGSNSHPEYVFRGVLTTQGDLPYRGASDWTRLAIGASNTHLISDGIVPKWVANSSGGGGGVTDHGALTGLADDDHPQYQREVSIGSVTAGGSPVTIDSDADHKAFPGLCRLDESRVLLVYRNGTGHLTAGNIVGRIGTLAANRQSVSSWGSEFTILDAAQDLRLQDALSVIDGKVVIAYREFDGTNNENPGLLISDVMATDVTSSTTWTDIAITLTEGDAQNYTSGHVIKMQNGRYLCPVGWQDSGLDHGVGVLLSNTLTDWSAPTLVTVGAVGAPDWAEIAVEEYPDGTLVAHLSAVDDNDIYEAESTDHGATWTAPAVAYGGDGFPVFRRLLSGNRLTVYRDSPDGDTAWRVAAGQDAAWGSESILDTTGTRSAYATILQLTPEKILCVYACEGAGGSSATDSDLYSQIFTDASTGYLQHRDLDGVTPDDHHSEIHKVDSPTHWTAETDTAKVLKPDGSGGVVWGTDATGSGGSNQGSRDGPITSGNKTTTSTTFVDVDATDFSITITTGAKRVLVGFVGAVQTNATAIVSLDIDIDGSRQGGDFGLTRTSMATTVANNMSFTYMSAALTAASHTFKLQWRTTAGTATLLSTTTNAAASFWVMELA
jgi:hypothetical protein